MDNQYKHEKLRELVQLYQHHNVIWDPQHDEHSSKTKKEEAWREISNQIGYPVDELKKKLTSLLGSYRREKSREKKSLTGRSFPYKSKWFAYDWFQFMDIKNLPQHMREMPSSWVPVEGAESTPKPKKGKSIVFASVKQACIDLVKKHGHSVSLIDEEAFRTLIQLMPMTMKEKARITSEYIQKCVDSTGEEDDADMSYQEERDASDNDDETTTDRVITIKGEIEEVQCNCNARVSEESNKFHEVGCPAAARQPYWNYFEVTTDEATCHICNLTLNWTNITKLKEHLLEKHPTAEFVDDGEEFVRGPASDVWSHEDTEEVYLEDDFDLDPLPTPSAKKRKRTSERLKSRDDRTLGEEDKLRQERVRAERLRTMRDERHGLSEASRKVIELAPDRFKSLDSFGQYVAELMKLIPKEKCLKYQVQIVQRLLQEQAAAG